MNAQVLEIGAGFRPATATPGKLLQNPTTNFTAIDARPKEISGAGNVHEYPGTFLAAEMAELPFANQSFSHVIMRSVFGEYTMSLDRTGSTVENTFLGMYEAFRVLKTGGQIIIAEENTPEAPSTPYQIGGILYDAGFEDITVMPCQNMTNDHWRKARTAFWGIEQQPNPDLQWRPGQPIDQQYGFLITAGRHNARIEHFQEMVFNKKLIQKALEEKTPQRDNEPRWRNGNFQRKAKVTELDDPSTAITVVTKDQTFPLSEYQERKTNGTAGCSFLV